MTLFLCFPEKLSLESRIYVRREEACLRCGNELCELASLHALLCSNNDLSIIVFIKTHAGSE